MSLHNGKVHSSSTAFKKSILGSIARSLVPRPDDGLVDTVPTIPLIPMSDLDLMIELGWGDTPRKNLPEDWRTRHA